MPRLNFWQKSRDKSKHQPNQPPTGSGSGRDTDPQAVTQALEAFINTENWDETRAMLEHKYALLLTDTADQILSRRIIEIQLSDDPSRQHKMEYLMLHLMLLRAARTQGINAAWEAFETALQPAEQDLGSTGGEQRTNLLPRDPDVLDKQASDGLLRYQTTGQLEDLNRALVCWHEVLKLTPPDSPNRPRLLNNLGLGLYTRYARTKALPDLEEAIATFQQAMDITPANSPHRPDLLYYLGEGLHARYERTQALPDLEQAITTLQQAMPTMPTDSPYRTTLLDSLGEGLHERYERTRALSDLEQAITALQQAVPTMPTDSPYRPGSLNKLGLWLHERYERTRALPDLEQVITAFQQAVDITSADSPERPIPLNNLGNGLHERYERTEALPDLEQAITAYQQAIDTASADSPKRSEYLNNLGYRLRERYKRTRALPDLERAIAAFQQAVDTTPADSPERSGYLYNLGLGLYDRYERTQALPDLERAIAAFQQAVATMPADSPHRPGLLDSLGEGLHARYERTRALPDLEQEIAAFQQAVDTTPADSPDRTGRLSNLGGGLCARYERTRALPDLEQAIAAFQQAVDITPADSPERSSHLYNLGIGLHTRYEHTEALPDLEQAITAYQQAVDTTPADSPYRPRLLTNLGTGLRERYQRTRALPDLERAIAVWEEGWSLLHSQFATLPVVYQLGQQRQSVDIATNLVNVYVGRVYRGLGARRRALEVAEGSKSRLLTQLIGRGPLPLPTGLSPAIAAHEQQLLADLTDLDTRELAIYEHPAPVREEVRLLGHLQRRQELWQELQQLWDGIAKSGADGADYVALRRGDTPTWPDIARLAVDLGPTTALLSFFTTDDEVYLFVVRAGWQDAPLVVSASLDDAGWVGLYRRFVREVQLYDRRRPLEETWEDPLRPLLDQAKAHLEGIERLVLVPEGAGHLLPWGVLIEHAGWRTPLGEPLSVVVLPALGVLPRLRQQPHIPPGPTLVVGNPTGDLPFAEEEANDVAQLFGVSPLLGAAATKATVLAYLEQASLIHLATHGFFDPDAPLEAGIVLADGVLTAREVLEHRLHTDLLVLSACESGLTRSLGGEELAGLSQAFFQAGVRSLLVSLWPVSDPATAALMRAFYAARQARADKAQALRQAMTQLQQDPRWTHPHYWGAFVLLGDWN